MAERARSARLLRGLALAHCNRGNAYTELGEPARALADYDRAADFLHLLSVRNPDPTLRSYLATCLSRRASVLVHFGKLTQSLDDMALVVDLRTRELQRETSSNTAHELGMSLVHRAEVHQLFGDQAASYDDFRACELTGWENTECLAALAAAQASKGDFRNAIRWQKQALELAGSEGAHAHRLRLELYERNEPYRLPMTPDASNTD